MKFRVAKKVVARWALGWGNYTWNRFGTVIDAHRKLESYYTRRGVDTGRNGPIQLASRRCRLLYNGLPGLPYY